MKWALWFLPFSLSAAALAVDPPFPTDKLEGFFFKDLDITHKMQMEPGKLDKCTENAGPSYTFWSCEAIGTEVTIDTGVAVHKFLFRTMSASEMGGSPTTPPVMSYYFAGRYGRTLPDGSTYETDVSMNFTRRMTEPEKLEGKLSVYTLGFDGGVFLKWPGGPDPVTPTPSPTPGPGPGPGPIKRGS